MDKLRAMQTFVRIAEDGSLTAAARTLGTSLPAVVRGLASYEQALGVRLFNRTTRKVTLTEEGRQHLERCRQVLAAVDDAENALRDEASAPAGQLTVTAPVLFGELHVAPVVTRFVRKHPGMRCDLVLLDRVVNLLDEGMDLGVRIGHLEDSSLVAQQLGRVRRVVVATPGYLRRHGTPRHPRDLLAHDCIRMLGGPTGWGMFQEQGRSFRVPVTGALQFNHVAPAVQACGEGAGIGMFFAYQVAALLAQKKLRIVLAPFELPPRPIQVVYPHARLLPARTRAFVEFLRAELTQFRD